MARRKRARWPDEPDPGGWRRAIRTGMVRVEGLEPPRLAAPEPKSGASTNFATPASARLLAKEPRACE